MGDHRASIKIEFSMYGETKKADMWINWSPDTSESQYVDQRVLDFFREAYLQMYSKHWESQQREERRYARLAAEEAERKEYERLKSKFEGETHGNC